ncbi:MAG: 2-C-methyl-D-erythritol 4-phosphate cytidylyltransferase [Candidatus Omnitrophota bacterium]
MKVSAIIPAAGLGLRFKSTIAKPLVLVNGEQIIIRTLKNLDSHPLINEIILVFNSKDIPQVRDLFNIENIKKVTKVIEGGQTRTDSVRNGLKCLSLDTELVLIHDGVRPFVDHQIITNVIKAALKSDAAIVAVPVKSTIKKVDLEKHEVEFTLNRKEIWEIQTPQVFKKDLILEAYDNSEGIDAPDDSFLVERLKHRVSLVEGSYFNIKITTPEDLILAAEISKQIK